MNNFYVCPIDLCMDLWEWTDLIIACLKGNLIESFLSFISILESHFMKISFYPRFPEKLQTTTIPDILVFIVVNKMKLVFLWRYFKRSINYEKYFCLFTTKNTEQSLVSQVLILKQMSIFQYFKIKLHNYTFKT